MKVDPAFFTNRLYFDSPSKIGHDRIHPHLSCFSDQPTEITWKYCPMSYLEELINKIIQNFVQNDRLQEGGGARPFNMKNPSVFCVFHSVVPSWTIWFYYIFAYLLFKVKAGVSSCKSSLFDQVSNKV